MRFLLLCFAVSLFILTAQGCAANRPDWGRRSQASVDSRKEAIVNRLIPEDGLTFTRRSRLIDATVAVLGKGDREELANLNRLRSTLQTTSLQNLERIEADYKERLANAND